MLPSFLLALREGLEIALIVGIVLGTLHKTNRQDLVPTVRLGVLSAVAVSLVAALLLNLLGATLEGAAEAIFEGVMMLLAAAVLTWMILWMQSRASRIKEIVADEVNLASRAGRWSLFVLAFVVVVREGIELALFLTAAVYSTSVLQTIAGAAIGLALAILLGWALFKTTVRLNLKRFFQVSSILLIFFAAGLVAHGVHEFNEVGLIPGVIEHVWDTNSVLDENSLVGQIMKTLFGYNGNPSLTEVLSYLIYFTVLFFVTRPARVPIVVGKQTAT